MQLVLGRKGRTSHAEFVRVWKDIEIHISKAEVGRLVDQAVREVDRLTRGKKAAYAWSGGKDSVALQFVMEICGIKRGVLGVMPPFEYPAFLQWLEDHMPSGIEWVCQYRFDLPWLAEHPYYLFPENSTLGYWWTRMGTHWSQRMYYEREKLDMLILGRRYTDGNYIAKNEHGIHTNSAGITQYNPIRRWPHEAVLGLCHYYKLPLPPVYGWPDGFTDGTGSWPSRQHCGSVENGFRKTYQIDPNVVVQAAEHIPAARDFLEKLAKGLIEI